VEGVETLVEPPTTAAPVRKRRWRLAILVVVVTVAVVAVVATERLDQTPPEPLGPAAGAWTVVPHTGLSAWVDVYDWTLELAGPHPSVTADDVDDMAEAGVQTLYIQTAHTRSGTVGVMEPRRLQRIIQRANDHRMHVVAWYLPTFEDVDADLQRLIASAELEVGGLAVDIESVALDDAAERNRRLLDLSARLRAAIGPEKAIAAITPSAVQLQVVNPAFWPGFPWHEIAATYDAILPMSYWTLRKGDLRNGQTYTAANLERIRASVGDSAIPIIPVGGLAEASTREDLQGMVAAIEAHAAPGGGLYDWASSTPDQWATLAPLAELQWPVPEPVSTDDR